ncbi:phosphatase PAP2 family protein [Aromatoleum evansii]|uniref:Phosphatase PAP2 family protein n=1 Tax=Aromatoleum evansii TaxID=59406 RepID=A0ABZ1AEV4_AROEV|nr:phosphatase PAP2 family protein [Aromatoleum evansii]
MSTHPLPSPSRSRESACWIAVPAAILALCALATLASGRNSEWFLGWNGAAAALPAFVWAGLTNLGATSGAFAVLAGFLAWHPRWAASALLAVPAGALYTHGAKEFFDEARPAAVLGPENFNVIGEVLRTGSFPSGHSATAFGFAAVAALCAVQSGRRLVALSALALASAVAFSRVAVGAHWPLDIFAGAAGGWLCGAFGVWWSSHWRFWERRTGWRVLAALLAAFSISIFFEELGYPEGRWIQYVLCAWGLGGIAFALARGPQPQRADA